jgi:hypothetical protein
MAKPKKSNSNVSKNVAMVARIVFIIQMLIIIVYIISTLSINDTFGLGRIASFMGELANSTLYVVMPLIIVGLVCMSIGALNYRKYHNTYSAIAFWLGLPSVLGLFVVLSYLILVGIAFTAG